MNRRRKPARRVLRLRRIKVRLAKPDRAVKKIPEEGREVIELLRDYYLNLR